MKSVLAYTCSNTINYAVLDYSAMFANSTGRLLNIVYASNNTASTSLKNKNTFRKELKTDTIREYLRRKTMPSANQVSSANESASISAISKRFNPSLMVVPYSKKNVAMNRLITKLSTNETFDMDCPICFVPPAHTQPVKHVVYISGFELSDIYNIKELMKFGQQLGAVVSVCHLLNDKLVSLEERNKMKRFSACLDSNTGLETLQQHYFLNDDLEVGIQKISNNLHPDVVAIPSAMRVQVDNLLSYPEQKMHGQSDNLYLVMNK